jgi:hypothetical protein
MKIIRNFNADEGAEVEEDPLLRIINGGDEDDSD